MACNPVVFEDVSPERWNRIEQELVGQDIGVSPAEALADMGTVTIKGSEIQWRYEIPERRLTVQCLDKPRYIPCGLVNNKMKELFNERSE